MGEETVPNQPSPEALMTSAMILFGIDPGEKAKLRGIPNYALRGRALGKTYKYRAIFEHTPLGDELTTHSYPMNRAQVRTILTNAIVRVHPLREADALFESYTDGVRQELLIGLPAQDRIATFLAEAQADVQVANA